jgi:hypothetical protein
MSKMIKRFQVLGLVTGVSVGCHAPEQEAATPVAPRHPPSSTVLTPPPSESATSSVAVTPLGTTKSIASSAPATTPACTAGQYAYGQYGGPRGRNPGNEDGLGYRRSVGECKPLPPACAHDNTCACLIRTVYHPPTYGGQTCTVVQGVVIVASMSP